MVGVGDEGLKGDLAKGRKNYTRKAPWRWMPFHHVNFGALEQQRHPFVSYGECEGKVVVYGWNFIKSNPHQGKIMGHSELQQSWGWFVEKFFRGGWPPRANSQPSDEVWGINLVLVMLVPNFLCQKMPLMSQGTERLFMAVAQLQEFCRQVKVQIVSNNRNTHHQTRYKPLTKKN